MNGLGRAVSFEVLQGEVDGRAGGQHRVGQDQHSVCEVAAADVFELDVEGAVFVVPAVGTDERVVGVVEVVQHTLVKRQAGAQDGGQHNAVGR